MSCRADYQFKFGDKHGSEAFTYRLEKRDGDVNVLVNVGPIENILMRMIIFGR